MVGTLVKTILDCETFIGLVKDYYYRNCRKEVVVEVIWNDCDDTTECFHEYEDYETTEYFFYHKGRWWEIHDNFHKFKQVLEDKCK